MPKSGNHEINLQISPLLRESPQSAPSPQGEHYSSPPIGMIIAAIATFQTIPDAENDAARHTLTILPPSFG